LFHFNLISSYIHKNQTKTTAPLKTFNFLQSIAMITLHLMACTQPVGGPGRKTIGRLNIYEF
jgi:hypothetical protein